VEKQISFIEESAVTQRSLIDDISAHLRPIYIIPRVTHASYRNGAALLQPFNPPPFGNWVDLKKKELAEYEERVALCALYATLPEETS
jgi:hypothetical protein